jgi:hypothetical protein
VKHANRQPAQVAASACSPRWHRAVITFSGFGKSWTTVFCCQWHCKKRARILTRKVPRWVARTKGSLIVGMVAIEEPRLKIRAFEPGTQRAAAQVENTELTHPEPKP